MKSREASRPPGYYSQATMVTASDDSSLDGDANYVPPEDDDDDDTSNDIGESETDDVEHVRRDDSGTNRIDFEDGVETSGHWRWKVQYNLSKAWRREGESTQSKASRSAVLSLSKPKKGFTGMPSTILLELNKVPYSATAMQPYPIEMVVSLAPRNTGQSKSSVLAHCERVCYLRIESWPGAAASTPPMNATKHVLIAFKTPELCEGFCRMVKPCIRLKALPPTGPWPKPNWVKKFVTLATGAKAAELSYDDGFSDVDRKEPEEEHNKVRHVKVKPASPAPPILQAGEDITIVGEEIIPKRKHHTDDGWSNPKRARPNLIAEVANRDRDHPNRDHPNRDHPNRDHPNRDHPMPATPHAPMFAYPYSHARNPAHPMPATPHAPMFAYPYSHARNPAQVYHPANENRAHPMPATPHAPMFAYPYSHARNPAHPMPATPHAPMFAYPYSHARNPAQVYHPANENRAHPMPATPHAPMFAYPYSHAGE